MIFPDGIVRKEPLRVKDLGNGLYILENAYEGDFWEYFPGKSIPIQKMVEKEV